MRRTEQDLSGSEGLDDDHCPASVCAPFAQKPSLRDLGTRARHLIRYKFTK